MQMDMSGEKEVVLRELMPEGERKLEVVNVEESTSKKGSGMLVWTVKDTETGKMDVIYTVTEPGKRWMLKTILTACNVQADDNVVFTFDIPDLIGQFMIGNNRHENETFINRKGEEETKKKNKFVSFRSAIPF